MKKQSIPTKVVHECEAINGVETHQGLLDQCQCGKVEFTISNNYHGTWCEATKCDVCELFSQKDDVHISTVVEPHYNVCDKCAKFLSQTKNRSKEYKDAQNSYKKMPERWVKYFKKIEKEQGIYFKRKAA